MKQEQKAESNKSGGARKFIDKAVAREGERRLFSNIVVILLTAAILFVSLFAPIKVTASGIASVSGSNESVTVNVKQMSQSIFKIFAALGYVNLNADDDKDFGKIKKVYDEYQKATEKADNEKEAWASRNPDAADSEIQEKHMEACVKYYSDCNIFAYTLAFTTVGALDKLTGEPVESYVAEMLAAQRKIAVFGLVIAAITAFLQLGLAVAALTFGILAVIKIIKKRPSGLNAFLTVTLLLSGVALVLLSFAPTLAPGGAMFAIAMTAAISYLVYGVVSAIASRKPITGVVKNAVIAGFAIAAFFVLCFNVILITLNMAAKSTSWSADSSVETGTPLGGVTEMLIMCMSLKTMLGIECKYSDLSVTGGIVTAILGVAAVIVLFVWLWLSLKRISGDEDKRVDSYAIIGAVLLIALAVEAAVAGGIGEPPVVTNGIGIHAAFAARAQVYVSLGFAVVAFLFGVLFPAGKKSPTAENDGH